jgi:glutamyl-tRNA synthetase
MHWCNAFIDSIIHVDGTIKSITMRLNSGGNFKTTKKKIHWIASTNTTRVILRDYDHLISKKKLEEDDDIVTYCNKQSVFDTEAYIDPQVLQLPLGNKSKVFFFFRASVY